MDVRFCEGRNHRREAHTCELRAPKEIIVRAPHKRASGEICFLLTKTGSKVAFVMPDEAIFMDFRGHKALVNLHGCRQA